MKLPLVKYIPLIIKIYISKIIGVITLPFIKNRKLWLVCERGDDARDNGFFFFKYLCENKQEIKSYYLIKKTSSDYNKVKSIGKVIYYGSFKHLVYLHLAECFISSHNTAIYPFSVMKKLIKKRLLKYSAKNIFLQHGVIKDCIKGLLYPDTKVDLFICGAKLEYEFIKNCYNHPEGVVKYTGLARFDNLHNINIKKQILLMPTWRHWLNEKSNNFLESEYFITYTRLLKNIDKILENTGYILIFYPHYEIQKFITSFLGSKNVIIADFANYDVQTLLKDSALLITDYSSVFFDFAYMKKPVIYYQFDEKKFFENHYNRGYFNYKEMGFGEVVDNEVLLFEVLKQYINNDCKITEKYLLRLKDFFPLYDNKNCERIYREITLL